MTAAELLAQLHASSVRLTVNDGRLRYRAPAGVLTPDLLEALAEHKAAVLAWLATAAAPWPAACLEAERRFGQPHARLFPLIGQTVSTPNGAGVLCQVFRDRAAVVVGVDLAGLAGLRHDQAPSMTFVAPHHVAPAVADIAENMQPNATAGAGETQCATV